MSPYRRQFCHLWAIRITRQKQNLKIFKGKLLKNEDFLTATLVEELKPEENSVRAQKSVN